MADEIVKQCKCCGEVKPISEFLKNRFGVTHICKECAKNARHKKVNDAVNAAKQKRVQQFTDRELMEELARRGYSGKLEITELHVVDINNM